MENANFASRDAGSQSASKFTFTFKINITGSFNQIGFRTQNSIYIGPIGFGLDKIKSNILIIICLGESILEN